MKNHNKEDTKATKDVGLTKEELNKQYEDLFSNTSNFKPKWKDLKKFINPQLGFFTEDVENQGNRDDEELLNQTAVQANKIQSAGMQSGITSPSRPWFKLELSNNELVELDEVKSWVSTSQDIMYKVFAGSNFYNNAHVFYEELGCFGSACMLVLEDLKSVVRFKTLTIGEYACGLDQYGNANRLARLLRLTVSQIVDMFGIDNVPETIKQQYKDKKYNRFYKVKHLIYPNPDYNPNKLAKKHMMFKDVYWVDECTDDKFLKEGGFSSNPICFARWQVTGSDIYGKSPGWLALSDSKGLQLLEADVYTATEMQVRPPMVVPASTFQEGGINIIPGGVNPYNPTGGNGDGAIRPAFQVNMDINAAEAKIAKIEASISKTFFADLFLMLEQIDHTNMTATEIQERSQEKMTMIGPVLERLQGEFLRPLIERTFELMMRVPNLLPPIPEVIQGMALDIKYVSILAQAQRMTTITGIQQTANFVASLAQAFPQALDKVDIDTVIDEYASAMGTTTMIFGDDKVEALRQQKQQQMMQQQQMAQISQMAQLAQQGGQAAQTLANTPTDNGNSALNQLLGIPGSEG
jgi:hypothetical protein